MHKVDALALAIMREEGIFDRAVAWKNSNPGCLRSDPFEIGNIGGFAKFDSFAMGWMRLWAVLYQYIQNAKLGVSGAPMTIQDLINAYAPASDGNDPVKYANDVCELLGVQPSEQLSWFLNDDEIE